MGGSDVSLLRLKIVLLRRINKLLEENPDAEEVPEQREELGKLRSTISDIQKAHATRNTSLRMDKPSLDTSFTNGSIIQLSQSPLFKGEKTLKLDLAEITLRHSNILDSSRIESLAAKDEILGSDKKKGEDVNSEIDTLRVMANELSKMGVGRERAATPKRSTSEAPRKESLKAKKPLGNAKAVEKKQVKEQKKAMTPKSQQPKGIAAKPPKGNPSRDAKSQAKKTNENAKPSTANESSAKTSGVKGLKMTEPQLKVTVDKSKLEEGMRKTPLGHINSMLSKIKTGEI